MSAGKMKWTPATVTKPKNQIISSDAVANNIKTFIPSFEKEPIPNMMDLLSNEYYRQWFVERGQHEKKFYSKGDHQNTQVKRKNVPRPRQKIKCEKQVPIIALKQFQNIPSKVDSGNVKRCSSSE